MMKSMILAATGLAAIATANPALAADMQDGAVQTVEVAVSAERHALALAAVDAYWPQGLSAYTTDYFLNTFADDILYTPVGELADRYGVVEMAGEIAEMVEEMEAMEVAANGEDEDADEEGEDEDNDGPDISPEQALKGMIAMFEDQRLVDIVAGQDEHFEERLKIVRGVIGEEMPKYSKAVEPKMRTYFADMFARRFNDQELRDLAAFAATPTGRKYAKEQWTMFVDPSYIRAMFAGAPESMDMMESIAAKLKERTAHLPPMFPEKEDADEAEEEMTAESLIEQAEEIEAEAAEMIEEAKDLRAQAAELE